MTERGFAYQLRSSLEWNVFAELIIATQALSYAIGAHSGFAFVWIAAMLVLCVSAVVDLRRIHKLKPFVSGIES